MENENLSPAKERSNIENLAVMLTYKCQLACRYCFLDRNHSDMPEDVLYRSIDLLFTSPHPEVELQFFGGEPLLRFDLIKKAIVYAENKAKGRQKRVKYLITTNGLLLDEKKLEYLQDFKVSVMFSMDGDKHTQLKNRPLINEESDYFDILLKNLKLLIKSPLSSFVNLAFLPEDIKDLKSKVSYLIGLGVEDIQLSYCIGSGFEKKDLFDYLGQLKEMKRLIKDKKINLRNLYNDIEPILSSTQITIDTNGAIYLGCAFIIERAFPQAHKLFYFGRLQNFKDILPLARMRQEQLKILTQNKDKIPIPILKDLYFGIGLSVFYPYLVPQRLTFEQRNYLYNDKMMLMLTYKCQLACRYCFLDRNHSDMPEDVLYRSIDLLFTSPHPEVELQFFGGEPLLRFDLIKKAIVYAENKAKGRQKRVKYLITTNGLLLDEKKLKFLEGFKVYFLLSMYGDFATQLFNRPLIKEANYYPFKKLIGNFGLLLRRNFDFFVNIVIGPDNIDLLSRNISFLLRHGVKTIRFSYELGVFWKDTKINEYFINIFKIMPRLTQQSQVKILNIGTHDEPCLSSPAFTVDYDGKIYCGCTIPLEKLFVNLRKVNLAGDVRINKTMQEIKKTKIESIRSLSDFYLQDSNSTKIILNNLTLGEISDRFFNNLFKKEKPQKLLKIDLPRIVNSLMLMCTYACQFNCDYCQIKRLRLSMSLRVLHGAVELLLTSRSQEVQLRFWGGEPLLEWRLIKEGIRFAEKKSKEKSKKIKFMITTNGLALDEKKLNYLKNHRVEIMFSLDGSLETDSAHRFIKNKNQTFQRTLMNLRRLIGSQLPYFVNVVVSPDTVSRLSHNLNFFKEFGVKRLQLCYRNGTLWSQEETEILINELKKFIQKGNNYDFLMNFTSDSEPTMLSQEILVDTDGSVYFDAAIFMEKVFPNLRKVYLLGRIAKLKDIDSLYRTRSQLYPIFKESCSPKERKIFLNNIDLGLRLDAALNSFPQQSLDSNEHPLFIPIIKGDFAAQRQVLEKLKIDSLFLYLDGPCLNNCVFCKHKEEKFSGLFKIETKLKGNLRIKGAKLCVIGNEPLMHPEIKDIIRLARTFGFRQIQIMTSGEYLCDTEFCRQLIKMGVTSFSLPLFAAQETIHDLIVARAGSFQQVMQAIKNILGNGAKVFVHANLIKHNIDYLKSLERFVRYQLKVPFVILPIRAKTANLSFKELTSSYTEVIRKLEGINSLIGFPLCVTGRIQEDLFISADDISDSMKLYLLDQRFFKLKVCDKCLYRQRCLGVFKEYCYLCGAGLIKPFKDG